LPVPERRQLLRALAAGAGVVLAPALACAEAAATGTAPLPATLPAPQSLAQSLAAALRTGQALVVMVSLEGCAFCKVVRGNYLGPMHQREGLAVVQIDMRSNAPVQDFQGANTTHDALVRAWGVRLAPTVLFFGPGGVEVAERLRGASIPDYYGAYLDERIRVARAAIQR
jgi:hypothetical protein